MFALPYLAAGCSPALNWREVRWAQGQIHAMLPCKPDSARRAQMLGGQTVDLTIEGCEADGGLYALSELALGGAEGAGQALTAQQGWEQDWLAKVGAPAATVLQQNVPGAQWSRALQACGTTSDGKARCSAALWFQHGTGIYQALIIRRVISADSRETFFASIRIP